MTFFQYDPPKRWKLVRISLAPNIILTVVLYRYLITIRDTTWTYACGKGRQTSTSNNYHQIYTQTSDDKTSIHFKSLKIKILRLSIVTIVNSSLSTLISYLCLELINSYCTEIITHCSMITQYVDDINKCWCWRWLVWIAIHHIVIQWFLFYFVLCILSH